MSTALSPQWKDALSLTRRQSPELYEPGSTIPPGPHADAIRFALTELGLAAVFCIEGVPTIAFVSEANADADRVDHVHRVLWNQGLMSLLLVIRPDELLAYSLVRRPFRRDPASSAADPRLITTLSLISDALKLRHLIESAESGRFWYDHDDFFDPDQRVDKVLLENLLQSFRDMKEDLGSDAAQALLMQAMFIAYLEDRKLIKPDAFHEAAGQSFSNFEQVLQASSTVPFEKLFGWLKTAFNGNVFHTPCSFETNGTRGPKLKLQHLKVLARFRRGKEEMVTGQVLLWGYDFQYMPIALISAVYDRFLKEEEGKKNAEGAFYTPMFLADVVVDQIWAELSDEQRASGVFYDPACGSGIFLVRLFQRLVANHCRLKNKSHASWPELVALARRVHGGDINASAVRVAVCSLYIAMLESSNPPDLLTLIKKGRLLPTLYGDTVRAEDFFKTPDEGRYAAVIGNPPWKGRAGQITTAQTWAKANKLPDPAKDIAWGFIWKSLRVVQPDGFVGLLLPAMGVLHNVAQETQNARGQFVSSTRIKRIVNLSDLCFQLFDDAQRPTAFAIYQPAHTNPAEPYSFEYWTPKADLNLRLKRLLTLARSDRVRLRSDQVALDPSVFKRRLWTRSPDEKLLQYLSTIPPLNAFVRQFKELRGQKMDRATDWVIGQGFKPAQESQLDDPNYQVTTAPAVTKHPYLDASAFESIVLPKIKSARWTTPVVHRAGFAEGFSGPHIIIPQGVERKIGRVRAAYTEQSLTFEHSLQAIAFPKAKTATAKLLTAVLNSSLAAWFYFHETANLGTDRAKVIQTDLLKLPFVEPKDMPDPQRAKNAAAKIVRLIDNLAEKADDLLRAQDNSFERIDALVFEYFGLSTQDVALIEDSFAYIIPAMQPRRSAGIQKIWNSSDINQRSAYAVMLCEALQPWMLTPVSATLAAKSGDVAVMKVTLGEGAAPYAEEASTEFDQFLKSITQSLPAPLPGNVQLIPDLRFVVGKDMYLVKPIQLRHWLRSAALADAEQIAAELSAAFAHGTQGDARRARG